MEFECMKCGRIFKRKLNLERHVNKIYPCDNIIKELLVKDDEINEDDIAASLNNKECNYCKRIFTRKSDLQRHLRNNCKVLKEKNDKSKQVYIELQNVKDKYHKMEKEINILKKKDNLMEQIEKENEYLKDELENLKSQLVNQNGNNNTINNNITIVAHGSEDLNRVYKNDKEIIFLLKKGWLSPRHSICKTHFNRKYPEYHNIYLPDTKNKYTVVYDGKKYVMKNTNEIISELYDQHIEYIEEKFKKHGYNIPDSKKRALEELFKLLPDAKNIVDKQIIADKQFENIKLLLFNNKDIPIDTRRYINGYINGYIHNLKKQFL